MNATNYHIVPRNRVNKVGQATFDIMAGDGNPENWEMVCEKITQPHATRFLFAINAYAASKEALEWIATYYPQSEPGKKAKSILVNEE